VPVFIFGIPIDFILFALTLIGVALFMFARSGHDPGFVACAVGFFVMPAGLGWNPDRPRSGWSCPLVTLTRF
jgi:hypothetical protein